MDNLEFYNKVRAVPEDAQKSIGGGRLKGMTDINPMWRIKTLTENFGMCGFGWVAPIINKWIEKGHGVEMVANVEILLRVKVDGEWSEPITGLGGSMFVANEKNGAFTSDEAFKMAYTDAISVACKMLGLGADIYWAKDRTKYDQQPEQKEPKQPEQKPNTANADNLSIAIDSANRAETLQDLARIWSEYKVFQGEPKFQEAKETRKKELTPNA